MIEIAPTGFENDRPVPSVGFHYPDEGEPMEPAEPQLQPEPLYTQVEVLGMLRGVLDFISTARTSSAASHRAYACRAALYLDNRESTASIASRLGISRMHA